MTKTILVVDDEDDIRTTVKQLLEREKYTVLTAIDGDDCLVKAAHHKNIDLILLDVMMPGTSVREVIQRLPHLKIAYLTVVRTTEAEKEKLLQEKNVVGFIQKPFDISDFIKTVKKLLQE